MIADLIHKLASFTGEEPSEYYARPSLAGPERCIRQMVYWGVGFRPEPLSGRTLVIFSDSSFHEELTLDWLRKSAFSVHSEHMRVDCRDPMTKGGEIDALLTDILQRDWLLEHKAINHFTFERYWNGDPPFDYLAQTCIYYDALRAISASLEGAFLLIKNKNTAAYLEYLIKWISGQYVVVNRVNSNGDIVEMNLPLEDIVPLSCAKFISVNFYIQNNVLPKRPYDIEDWHCQYCGWGKTCWGDYQKEFYELKTDVMLPNEVADMVRYYKELGGQKRDVNTEYEGLREKIRKVMKDNNVREGFAGEYLCKLKLQKNNTERLYISTLKGGKHDEQL